MLRVVIFTLHNTFFYLCFLFLFFCRDVDVVWAHMCLLQHIHSIVFNLFFEKATHTHSPPSLSSIQCLGARKRFKCFLGPRAMVLGRRCCCYATDSLGCSADIQPIKIRQNFPIRRFAAKLISMHTYIISDIPWYDIDRTRPSPSPFFAFQAVQRNHT